MRLSLRSSVKTRRHLPGHVQQLLNTESLSNVMAISTFRRPVLMVSYQCGNWMSLLPRRTSAILASASMPNVPTQVQSMY